MPKIQHGFDVILVTVNTRHQANYWRSCLEAQRGFLFSEESHLLVLTEEWKGAAGNCLGTLNTYQQARHQSRRLWNNDLLDLQRQGAAVAIVHTAGYGKRIAPLSLADYGNKSALKMPQLIDDRNEKRFLTLLEAVIYQINDYAQFRKQRLSVFWGDQICLPAKGYREFNSYPVMVAAKMAEVPTEATWNQQHLDSYGILLRDGVGNAQQIEKVDYETFKKLLDTRKIRTDGGVGISCGSFSLSLGITEALLEEFSPELHTKHGNLDVEPHIWMPLTLDRETYLDLMKRRNGNSEDLVKTYERMQKFKQNLMSAQPSPAIIGINDLGSSAYWWDFGTLHRYHELMLKLLNTDQEGAALRGFFDVPLSALDSSKRVLKIASDIKSQEASNCVLLNVHAKIADLKDSVVVDVTAQEIKGRSALFYKVCEAGHLELPERGCCADLCLPHPQQNYRLYTSLDGDGKKEWKERLPHNPLSYAECALLCSDVNIEEANALWHKRKVQVLTIPKNGH